CVVEVGEDERVRDDGAIERPDGGARQVGACLHPSYDRHGRVVDRSAHAREPTVNGWVADENSTSPGPVQFLSAKWLVPPAPTFRGGQTVYFFPGLEPLSDSNTFILQPVLAWNGFSDQAWTITSWNCCRSGNAFHGNTAGVIVGDTITGKMTGTNCT